MADLGHRQTKQNNFRFHLCRRETTQNRSPGETSLLPPPHPRAHSASRPCTDMLLPTGWAAPSVSHSVPHSDRPVPSRPLRRIDPNSVLPFRVFLGKPQGDLTTHTHTSCDQSARFTGVDDSGGARVHPNPAQTRCHLGAGMWRGVSVLTVMQCGCPALSLSSLYSPLPRTLGYEIDFTHLGGPFCRAHPSVADAVSTPTPTPRSPILLECSRYMRRRFFVDDSPKTKPPQKLLPPT